MVMQFEQSRVKHVYVSQSYRVETRSHLHENVIKSTVAKGTSERLFGLFGRIQQIRLIKQENALKGQTRKVIIL
jgi:hypothetical protein